jgi:hypothetical protein
VPRPWSLTPLAKLAILTWIGNAAAVLWGRRGDVTRQAQPAGRSRTAASQHAHRVQQAVAAPQAGEPSREQLLQRGQQLAEENRQLGAALETALDFPEAKQRRFVATAAALGLSLQQTLVLLALVLPAACCPRRATRGRWVQQAAARASRVPRVVDRACRGLVRTLCLDAIFCHRLPLLIGVEPPTLAWPLGQRGPDRTGETWAQALAPWSQLTYAVVDGGSGLRRGLELVQQQWQRQAPLLPPLPVATNLANFPIQQEGQAAEHGWVVAEEADREVARASRQGRKKRGPVKRALCAWAKARSAFAQAQQREAAWGRAAAAREWFRPDGRLNDRAGAEAASAAAVRELPGERWAKTCRLLPDARALTFLDQLAQELGQAEPRAAVRAAVVERWRLEHRGERGPGAAGVLAALPGQVGRQLAGDWQASAARVGRVLERAVRASSVGECRNSVVRMHQARHRTLTQPLLDWKRLYWNCRGFAGGKRRGHGPYEHLGLRLPTYDAWALLQMDPEELAQQLSTAKVAA